MYRFTFILAIPHQLGSHVTRDIVGSQDRLGDLP